MNDVDEKMTNNALLSNLSGEFRRKADNVRDSDDGAYAAYSDAAHRCHMMSRGSASVEVSRGNLVGFLAKYGDKTVYAESKEAAIVQVLEDAKVISVHDRDDET